MKSKFEWTEENEVKPIRMEDLVCKDCFHRGVRVSMCAVYQDWKPDSVLDGGKCEYYKQDA